MNEWMTWHPCTQGNDNTEIPKFVSPNTNTISCAMVPKVLLHSKKLKEVLSLAT